MPRPASRRAERRSSGGVSDPSRQDADASWCRRRGAVRHSSSVRPVATVDMKEGAARTTSSWTCQRRLTSSLFKSPANVDPTSCSRRTDYTTDPRAYGACPPPFPPCPDTPTLTTSTRRGQVDGRGAPGAGFSDEEDPPALRRCGSDSPKPCHGRSRASLWLPRFCTIGKSRGVAPRIGRFGRYGHFGGPAVECSRHLC